MADTVTDPKVAQRGAQSRESASPRQSITAQLLDPDSPIVQEALGRRCDQCRAGIGTLCTKRGGFAADLQGRLIHLGRMHDANPRKEPG